VPRDAVTLKVSSMSPVAELGAEKSADSRNERGVAAVWMAIVLFLLLGATALAIDIVHGYLQATRAQNAVDAASLGGVVFLPDEANATGNALDIAAENGFANDGDTTVTVTKVSDYELKVDVKRRFKTFFASVMGFDTLTVRESATAAYEPPDEVTAPLDLMVILDRTNSMVSAPDPGALADARAAAHALLDSLDPSLVHVALGLTGPSQSTQCAGGGYGLAKNPATGGMWNVSPFPATNPTNDYTDPNSQIRKTITCLNSSNVGTNLGDPIEQATLYMQAHHNPGAKQAIILMTDGEANQPNSMSCEYAFDKADMTKDTTAIEIVTIGFGIEGSVCGLDAVGSSYRNVPVTQLLADMASPNDDGTPADDDFLCTEPENTDGDNFFCLPKDEDLSKIFVLAAEQLSSKRSPRLIK
jgi:Flp pilus assembly protein TadG